MAIETPTRPVQDTVAKFNDEVAVGEDLEFQRKWWKFEKAIWIFFGLLVLLDLAGLFGRGPLANAHKQTADGAMTIKYEWVERFSTPSILTVHFSPDAVRNGQIRLWVSESVVKTLGNQRIIPQPTTSLTGDGGVLYIFPSSSKPDSVEFALQPAEIGRSRFELRLIGDGTVDRPRDSLNAGVFVMP